MAKLNTPVSHFVAPGIKGTPPPVKQDTILAKIREAEEKYDACNMYILGQVKHARNNRPEYIKDLEKRVSYRSDFFVGIALFVLSILMIVYVIVPRVGTSQKALLVLFTSIVAIFYLLDYATKKIRFSRSKQYMETKELPRLKREAMTHKSNIDMIMTEHRKKVEKEAEIFKKKKQSTSQSYAESDRKQYQSRDYQSNAEKKPSAPEFDLEEDPSIFKESNRFDSSANVITAEAAYKILDVQFGASKADVQKGYREAVHQFHPDRVAHLGEEFRVIAEQRTKLLNKAYEFLMRSLID